MAARGKSWAMVGALCAALLHSLLPAASGSSIVGSIFCDKCWDGSYSGTLDLLAALTPVSLNCSISSVVAGQTSYTYVWATGGTTASGSFQVAISGATGTSALVSANAAFLNALFIGGNPLTGQLASSQLLGCSVTASSSLCPVNILNNGQCSSGGLQGNAFISAVTLTNLASTSADISLGVQACYAPSVIDASCPAATPPPPGGVGDPHYTGADGSRFDFSGEPNSTFCLVSDSHLHINVYYGGRYGRWGSNPHKALTWIRQIGILWGHHTIVLAAREGARWQYDNGYLGHLSIDGQDVQLGQAGDYALRANGDIEVRWLAAKRRSGDDLVDVYQITVGDVLKLRLTMRPEIAMLRTPTDGVVHFDFEMPVADLSDDAHGVLGQTFRSDHKDRLAQQQLEYNEVFGAEAVPGDDAEGFLDGSAADYRSSSLLRADCRYARFLRAAARDRVTERATELASAGAKNMLGESAKSFELS